MSMNTTFKTYNELTEYLSTIDHPQCFTVNYLPDSNEYALWIGNQPYYVYEKWIEEEEQKVRDLIKENLMLKGEIFDLQKENEKLITPDYIQEQTNKLIEKYTKVYFDAVNIKYMGDLQAAERLKNNTICVIENGKIRNIKENELINDLVLVYVCNCSQNNEGYEFIEPNEYVRYTTI